MASPSSADLRACPHSGLEQNTCSSDDDIIISCFREGSIRLVNSEAEPFTEFVTEGRLEIYLQGEWGTVCDHVFSSLEPGIACNEMGFHFATRWGNVGTFDDFQHLSVSSRRIWLDGFDCPNIQSLTLFSCDHNPPGSHSCSHSEDVIISCVVNHGFRAGRPVSNPTPSTSSSSPNNGGTGQDAGQGGGQGTSSADTSSHFQISVIASVSVVAILLLLAVVAMVVTAVVLCLICSRKKARAGGTPASHFRTSTQPPQNVNLSVNGSEYHSTAVEMQGVSSESKPLHESTLQGAPPPSYSQVTSYPSTQHFAEYSAQQ